MKYINILALFLLSLLLFSCESEETLINEQRDIQFVLSPQTKSTQTGSFEIGDDIGVFAVERTNDNQVGNINSPKYVNVQYKYNGASFDAVGEKIMYSGKKYDFYAYSPYEESYTNIKQIIHSAATNQMDQSGWLKADFCSSINTTGIAAGDVPLSFDHKFATVQLIVDHDVQTVNLLQVQTSGLFSFSTNKAVAQGGKSDVNMYKESPGSFLATFPAQTLSGTIFKITKSNNKTVDFNLPTSKSLAEGVNVIYTIDLKATITINQSLNGTGTGGGEYEVGDTCIVKAIPDSGYEFEGWYDEGNNKVSSDSEYKFIVAGDRNLTPMFQSIIPVETWVYTFSVGIGNYYQVGWQSDSQNIPVTSYKQKHLNGIPSGSPVNVGYNIITEANWLSSYSWSLTQISWDENPSSTSRTGGVRWTQEESGDYEHRYIVQEARPEDVILVQEGWEIKVTPTSHTFPSMGGSKTFTVTLNKVIRTYTNNVLTKTERIPQSSGWTSATSGVGFTNSGDTVTASTNTSTSGRSGTFTASYKNVSASASLYQEGADDSEIIIQ